MHHTDKYYISKLLSVLFMLFYLKLIPKKNILSFIISALMLSTFSNIS